MFRMKYLLQAILLEAGFTAFWSKSPKATLETVHGELCGALYRKTFVTNAAIQRAVDHVSGDIDAIYCARTNPARHCF